MEPQPLFKFYLQPDDNNYYIATPNSDGTWSISTTTTPTPVNDTPKDWNNTTIKWARSSTYLGVFRSLTEAFQWPFSYDNYKGDAAAILRNIYYTQDVQGECMMRIDMRIDTESTPGALDYLRYETVYQSELDFSQISIDYQGLAVTINALDGKLYELIKSYGDTPYNIPFDYTDPEWVLLNMQPVGMYAVYGFIGPDRLAIDNVYINITSVAMGGIAYSSTDATRHYLASLANLTPTTQTANEQTSVFVPQTFGADILKELLVVNTGGQQQGNGADSLFLPYTKNNNSMSCLTVTPSGANQTLNIEVQCQVEVDSGSSGSFTPGVTVTALFLDIMLVGYNSGDFPVDIQKIYSLPLNFSQAGSVATIIPDTYSIDTLNVVSFQENLVYAFTFGLSINPTISTSATFSWPIKVNKLFYKMNGEVFFPVSQSQAYGLGTVFNKLTQLLSSIEGNYGFPIPPISSPYEGVSTYLNDASQTRENNYDALPALTYMTSGNALRNFNYNYPYQIPVDYPTTQQYLTTTLNNFQKSMFCMYGCGMGIEGNNLRIEPLKYFFDPTTEILNLDDMGILPINFNCIPITELMGNNITIGYSPQTYNLSAPLYTSGMNEVNLQQKYQTPITKTVQSNIDFTNPYRADCIGIEYARANQNQEAGTDSTSDNDIFFFESTGNEIGVTFAVPGTGTINAVTGTYNPGSQSVISALATNPQQYSSAHLPTPTTYPNPLVAPFIGGLPYGNTMYNLGLTPKKCAYRLGGYLRSIFPYDNESLLFQTFSKTSYIDPVTNLNAGLIDEYADLPINTLPDRLFYPRLFKFDTPQPINFYSLITNNPNGYISFSWRRNQYKGFIWEVSQRMGDNGLSSFQLLAHPDTDFSTL